MPKKRVFDYESLFLGALLALTLILGAFFVEGHSLFKEEGEFPLFSGAEFFFFLLLCSGLLASFIALSFLKKEIKIHIPFLVIAGLLIICNLFATFSFPGEYEVTTVGGESIVYAITDLERIRYTLVFIFVVAAVYAIIDIAPQVFAGKHIIDVYLWIVVAFGFIAVIFSLFAEWDKYISLNSVRITSFTNNRNVFGYFLLITMGAMIIIHERHPHFWHWPLIIFFFIWLFFPVSKTSIIVACAVLACYAIYRGIVTIKKHWIRNAVTTAIVVAITLTIIILGANGLLSSWRFYQNVIDNFADVGEPHNTFEARIHIWEYCFSLMQEPREWIFGFGDGVFASILGLHDNGVVSFGYVHNGFLCALFYGGIIRFLAETALWLFYIYLSIRLISKKRWSGILYLLLIIGFIAHAFSENTFLIGGDSKALLLHVVISLPLLIANQEEKMEENHDYSLLLQS